ncbi:MULTISPECIES: AraC family transcriptional regulator [unclassified Synechococcus]|uniref:AraC family transcriptional regulator n=1 Tax=unclassified Synechococcus TaxID=2626047 RepID=UPI0021A70894|nr:MULTISPECIES: AraC family transcriptional regulator [unclassified Synechococcus]MCT0213340.1 helix-turn-helix domain-containing protein [Synechococcus sp. CS-1326]MCT0232806.1 helix-turn-helix domain-containing protein [Synechococcus sp. CS-1327]
MIRFGCVEELATALAGFGLRFDLIQLEPGPLHGDLLALSFGSQQLLRVRFDRALHIAGAKPAQRQLFSFELGPAPLSGQLRSHGQSLPADVVFGMATTGEVHLTTGGKRSLAVLVIDPASFQQVATALGHGRFADQLCRSNWLPIEPRHYQRLRRHLLQLFALSELSPPLRGDGLDPVHRQMALQADLQADLLPLLVEILAAACDAGPQLRRAPARIEVVKQAQDWMVRHPDRNTSLDGICQELRASRRTLIQGFQDHLGMGPMAFRKLQRLHMVRQALLAADPQRTTITAVAARFGLLSGGHFARDYRLLFGERPGFTLAAPAKTRPQSRRMLTTVQPREPA